MSKNLLLLIDKLERNLPQHEERNPAISTASVGWHIEHTLMVLIAVTESILKSKPQDYRWRFNKNRLLVFAINRIPRGKAKAPAYVLPDEAINIARINKYLELIRERLNSFDSLHPRSFIKHPFLGLLNRRSTIKFLELHTRHHVKIIEDILS